MKSDSFENTFHFKHSHMHLAYIYKLILRVWGWIGQEAIAQSLETIRNRGSSTIISISNISKGSLNKEEK